MSGGSAVIDTVRLQWPDVRVGEGFRDWLEANYPSYGYSRKAYSWDLPWEGFEFTHEVLGVVGVKRSRLGDFLWVERSLPKMLHGDNCKQLTMAEAREGLALLSESVVGLLGDFLPHSSVNSARVQRVDFYHQREMPSAEVFGHIARCIKRQKGVALHLTGVEVHQSREVHGRFYDKGIESGNEQYIGVVRHEEQLRGKVARSLLDMETLKIDRAAVRAQMNKRFDGWPAEVECHGYESLLQEHKHRGAAAVALCELPQLEPMFKAYLAKDMFYTVKNLALEAQRKLSRLDLRVPEGAWVGPGV